MHLPFLNHKYIIFSFFIIVLFFLCLIFNQNHTLSSVFVHRKTPYTVCLDAGHGGADPGKVSASGILEKDINLSIALACQKVLQQHGIHVVMTRTTDDSLCPAASSHAKREDLEKRREIIMQPGIDCTVSIHQNSFPDTSQHGAQVFYNTSFPENKKLAESIQANLMTLTGEPNTRKIKENADYYLLRDHAVPTVIAEICFLSNPSEAEEISKKSTQEKAGFQIAMGIIQYLNTK